MIFFDTNSGDDVKDDKADGEVGGKWVITEGLPNMPLYQGDHGAGSSAKRAINMEESVHNTGGEASLLAHGDVVDDISQAKGAHDKTQGDELGEKKGEKTAFLLIHGGSFRSF